MPIWHFSGASMKVENVTIAGDLFEVIYSVFELENK